ncbi:MAG: hypothetical protein AB7O13_26325, partial [Alphaproteobacteria bacterium]
DLHCSGTMITPAAISVPTDLKAPARGDLPVRRAKSSSGSKQAGGRVPERFQWGRSHPSSGGRGAATLITLNYTNISSISCRVDCRVWVPGGFSMRKLLVVGLAGAAAIGSFLLIEGRPQANACRGNYWNLGDAHAAGERHQNAVVTFERNTPGMAGKDN